MGRIANRKAFRTESKWRTRHIKQLRVKRRIARLAESLERFSLFPESWRGIDATLSKKIVPLDDSEAKRNHIGKMRIDRIDLATHEILKQFTRRENQLNQDIAEVKGEIKILEKSKGEKELIRQKRVKLIFLLRQFLHHRNVERLYTKSVTERFLKGKKRVTRM